MSHRLIPTLARAYLVALLLALTLLGHAPHMWIGLALLVLQAAALHRSPPPGLDLLLTLVTLLLAPLGFAALVGGAFSPLLLLPALPLPDSQLQELAVGEKISSFRRGIRTLPNLNALGLMLGAVGLFGIVANSFVLLGSTAVLLAALGVRLAQEAHALCTAPLTFESGKLRLLAGSSGHLSLIAANQAPFTIYSRVRSPYPGLLFQPEHLTLAIGQSLSLEAKVTPALAGPSEPELQVVVQGAWGLLATGYSVTPMTLHVIPRARYAAWLAQRYLEETRGRQGVQGVAQAAPLAGRGRGVEFHRLREYEPGDSLRDIEWRHTLKLGNLVIKERLDPREGAAVLLVNLVATNPEEADWLAYHLVMSALSAARQEVPTSLLAYTQRESVLARGPMDGRDALKLALHLSTQLTHAPSPLRLLEPPNIRRLERSVRALESDAQHRNGASLGVMLRLELGALEELARHHPLASLVRTLMHRVPNGATITVVSRWNHDAEALAVTLSWLRGQGYRIVDPSSRGGSPWTS